MSTLNAARGRYRGPACIHGRRSEELDDNGDHSEKVNHVVDRVARVQMRKLTQPGVKTGQRRRRDRRMLTHRRLHFLQHLDEI